MNNRELHYKYAISYLLLFIIIFVSLAFFDVQNLVDKLSFALTLSSLLLAILAIFYTIVSEHKQDSQFSKIIETNTELKLAANEIKSVSSSIGNLLDSVPTHFKNIADKIDLIGEKYNSPNYEKVTSESVNNEDYGETIKVINFDKKLITMMIVNMQYAAMGVLYLFVNSFKKGKSIELDTIPELGLNSYDYAIGFLNGLGSTGIISFKFHGKALIPTKCNKILAEETPSILDSIIKSIEGEQGKNLKEKIQAIDKTFA